ncbi:MAG: hypothetical protein LBE22_02750 [Azoarcus sp.]|jgi:hypothetical protein|nr:hypothetical protein [Azoarcus sp.]
MMGSKDLEIKQEIDKILQGKSVGMKLKTYFENMPEERIRRAIHVFASIYPDKQVISDDDFVFIPYILSEEKFLKQQSFSDFIRSLNLIHYTENQRNVLVNVIKEHFEALCEVCTFELDSLLIKIFGRSDLFRYMETLASNGSAVVLQRISDILKYEDFSSINVSDEALERLRMFCTNTKS